MFIYFIFFLGFILGMIFCENYMVECLGLQGCISLFL
uniref:Uncharacterized protein n=1 Tax=Rhizophora mucronata TaxID=61149 RepID=A0A2P2QLP2_RHIMU